MDDFEIVDKNILEIDINEQNLNSNFNTINNDFSPEKDYDFSIISNEIKHEDVGNIIESDCTSPLIIENVDLNTEFVENINNEFTNNDSFPLTMLSIPLSTLDANQHNTDNCSETLKENLDGDDKVNLLNNSLNINNEKESICSNNESLENSKDKSNRTIENVQTNIISEVNNETNTMNVNEESSFSKNDTEIIELSNKIDEINSKAKVIKENDIDTLIDDEIDRENSNIVSDELNLLSIKDEPDFRVNIIERNDSEDKWLTNEYIHNDNIVIKPSDNIDKIDKNKEEKNELDLLNKKDEPDFRVNIIERNDSEDKWTTNEYIHNDNIVIKPSDNIDEKKEEKNELNNETSDSNKNESINNSDEPDFRVNIIERNDSEDKWSVSEFAPNTEANKEIPSEIKKNENQLINSEINSSNLEVIKSDSIESSKKDDISNNDEIDSKNNEIINYSNGNVNDEIVQEPGNQQNENETILSKSQENVTGEISNQSELENNEIVTESQKIDTDNNKINIDGKTRELEPVIIRPLGVEDPRTFSGMSAVIHVLFNCVEFRRKMIEYHNTDQIAYFNLDSNPNIKSEDLLFINDLCKLFVVMKENNYERKIYEVGRSIRNYFRNFDFQLNAVRGFDYILEKINAITRIVSDENNPYIKEEDITFFNFKLQNKSFVNDLFIGQIMNTTFCCKCHKEHQKTYDHIRFLSLKIPAEKNNVNLENCIKNLFGEVKIEAPHNYNCCSEPDIKLDRKFTHIPEYLFIYLDRKLENNGRDNTFVETDNGIFLESVNGFLVYSLCSVIDELFVNQTFLNSVKCLSDAWWNIGHTNCRKIADFEIITGNSIGFMFKKQID